MSIFNTSREINASVEEIFAAFSDPERLARWWGPSGFTNTFHLCEFKTGGRWVYTMHSPNGGNPENESIFELVEPTRKVIIRHISQPLYRLTIELLPTAAGTIVSWSQVFDNAEVAQRIAKIVIPANEQNLDRLTAEVLKTPVVETQTRYFHGTKADLKPGDMIGPGYSSNYTERQSPWVYFSGTLHAATWGAELAKGEGPGRIYIVEPTGEYVDDPNVTDRKFPGNPTKSFRSKDPLRVVREVLDWVGHSLQEIEAMKHAITGLEPIDD